MSDARIEALQFFVPLQNPVADVKNPESISEILMLGRGDNTLPIGAVGTTGYLQLDGHMPLDITSPQLTSFGRTLGPRGEHTICKKVNAQSLGFGGQILDLTQHEQDHIVCGGSNLQTLTFRLVNARGQVLSLIHI